MTLDDLIIFHLGRLFQVEKCLLPVRRRGVRRRRQRDSVGELYFEPEGDATNSPRSECQNTEIAADFVLAEIIMAKVEI